MVSTVHLICYLMLSISIATSTQVQAQDQDQDQDQDQEQKQEQKQEQSTYRELSWGELMPEDWQPPPPPSYYGPEDPSFEFSQMLKSFIGSTAPVVKQLNKKMVKIPGYVIPIVFDDESISEFLLVPYIGACIHVPPPPSNQMVYVKLDKPIPNIAMWDPVWASGMLLTERTSTEFAEPGYTMDKAFLTKYEFME